MKRTCIGKIAAAHGVKGLVKILPLAAGPGQTQNVYTSEDGPEMLEIRIKNPLGKYLLAEIEGITNRNAAEALGKCPLYIDGGAPENPAHENLSGKTVLGADGAEIGTVIGVENYGAGDLLDICLKSGKTVMVPLTPDFVPQTGETALTVVNYEAFL